MRGGGMGIRAYWVCIGTAQPVKVRLVDGFESRSRMKHNCLHMLGSNPNPRNFKEDMMDRDTWRKMEQVSKEFYDTIDFKQFIPDEYFVDIDDLREKMEEYYDHQHPELLPPGLEGYIFNVVDRHDFTTYLENRFGCLIKHEVVDRYYIINDDDFKEKLK